MRIPFGKISVIAILSVASASAQDRSDSTGSAPSSGSDTPVSEARSTPAGKAEGNLGATEGHSQTSSETSAAMDYLMNRKPQDGSAGKQLMDAGKRAEVKGVAAEAVGIPQAGDPEVQARFERYLGTEEVSQEKLNAYAAQMKVVSRLLRDNKLFDAWRELHELAEDRDIDAGISRELANRIEAIWNMDRATGDLDRKNRQLKNDVKTANRNADLMSKRVLEEQIEYERRTRRNSPQKTPPAAPNGGVPPVDTGGAAPTSMAGIEGKLQLTEEYLRSLELKARIKMNELRQGQLLEQAKADFSQYISALFNSGRLNHVVLAADFYRKVFQEGEYPVEMAKQVNASLEIQRDVDSMVDVFRYKVGRGELTRATESLQAAFLTSELSPAVLGLERSLKEKVSGFLQKLEQMRNLIEARDFSHLEVLLKEIQSTVTDFDTTKPMAIVNAVKLESRMRLGKAKLFAQQGNLEKSMEEFQAAAEAWPGNPELEANASRFFNTQDIQSQSIVEFDRLVAEKDFRQIFEKQLAFAPALRDDQKRQEALKEALLAIKEAEMAAEKANVMIMNGDTFGAWETIELAAVKLPDDKKLNRLRADLSGRSAEFVSAINKARDAETRSETGYSLTWYVNAQRLYPASQIANEAIERLSRQLLNADSTGSAQEPKAADIGT